MQLLIIGRISSNNEDGNVKLLGSASHDDAPLSSWIMEYFRCVVSYSKWFIKNSLKLSRSTHICCLDSSILSYTYHVTKPTQPMRFMLPFILSSTTTSSISAFFWALELPSCFLFENFSFSDQKLLLEC